MSEPGVKPALTFSACPLLGHLDLCLFEKTDFGSSVFFQAMLDAAGLCPSWNPVFLKKKSDWFGEMETVVNTLLREDSC